MRLCKNIEAIRFSGLLHQNNEYLVIRFDDKMNPQGLDEAKLKTPTQPNPAFPSRSSSRESDGVGSEDICEHRMNSRAVMMIAKRPPGVIINKRAEFRRTELEKL